MDKLSFLLGKTLRIIRENKGYTQQEVADHRMSRSNYSKLEQDEINPNVVKYFAILDHLDIRHDEFIFILNDYKLDSKAEIFHHFKEMEQKPSIQYVIKLVQSCKKLLIEREDHITRDIYNIALGYYSLLEDHDLKKACDYASVVWDRLKELDKFYLSEYHLLNGILYYFELETAVSMTDKALKELKTYYPFKEANELTTAYLLNITCILIAHKEYTEALHYVDRLIEKSKKDYDILALASGFTRKGICLENLEKEKEAEEIYDSAIELFDVVNRKDLTQLVKKDPKAVYNIYAYVQVEENYF